MRGRCLTDRGRKTAQTAIDDMVMLVSVDYPFMSDEDSAVFNSMISSENEIKTKDGCDLSDETIDAMIGEVKFLIDYYEGPEPHKIDDAKELLKELEEMR